MRWGVGVLTAGIALVVLAGVAAAGGAPIVSPGLDQDVVLGDTVYLDGGGTHVPDGELDRLEWSIETPDGRTITPECVDCEQTSFEPNETGQYNVTLTAWSESEIERSDTLYVTAQTPATTASNPAMEGSSNGGGSGGGGCYIGYASDTGDHVCSHVGDTVDVELGGGGNYIESVIVTDEGFTNEYSGVERAENGRWRIDYDTMESETEGRYEAETDDRSSPSWEEKYSRDGSVSWPSGGAYTGNSDSEKNDDSRDSGDSNPSPFGGWL